MLHKLVDHGNWAERLHAETVAMMKIVCKNFFIVVPDISVNLHCIEFHHLVPPAMNYTTRNHQSKESLVTLRSHGNRDLHRHLPSGFALVVSLTMMILMTIIAIGLLSLSAVSLRSAEQGAAMANAQAKARMALMIAIGELQKQMGPDQRISANGAITDPVAPVEHPHWTGVWDSWVAGDLAKAPIGSDYPSARRQGSWRIPTKGKL